MGKTLILESATRFPSVGIKDEHGFKLFISGKEGNHSVFFFEIIQSIKKENIEKIILTIGPGRFTSLRVGLSFALGLAIPRRIKIIPLNTFDLLEYEVRKKHQEFGIFLKKGGTGFLFKKCEKEKSSEIKIVKELPEQIPLFTFEPVNIKLDYEIIIIEPRLMFEFYVKKLKGKGERIDYENIKPIYSFLPYEKSLIEKGKIKGY